eukprot:CAMPEP_0206842060 /NCGR_PEP_ID=MMETSP0975-20121206/22767_1 /ASSEMBLY_ACC=CAM_ASM_000399 /TAXON_ID=483370 /ORGANISM="non described non described, Strain CCMP2097" /LENGTH=455 /DNA_ID=CAMNT_0054384579 /DNA_START=15 /DNA_END=1383 /DNA_ORIENTATION=+
MQSMILALALVAPCAALAPLRARKSVRTTVTAKLGDASEPVVLIGVAADSGCGKSTFMRRLTGIFGGSNVGPLGGGFDNGSWETNTLVSDTTTVICLDDYHLNDRNGRKVTKRTALDLAENNFDLMYEQLSELKKGNSISKPIYNHVNGTLDASLSTTTSTELDQQAYYNHVNGTRSASLSTTTSTELDQQAYLQPRQRNSISKPIYNHVNGTLDTPETIVPTPIVIIEGLHPMADARVRGLLDFSLYLDITDDVKFAWKIQRDMVERGHSLESIQQSIEARKPDFDAFVAPQRAFADITIQVLPTQLVEDTEGKILRVKFIQRTGKEHFDPVYLFDEGSTIEWTPCGKKLTCSFPGIKFAYGPDTFMDNDVMVVEMDGKFDNLQELIYVESHLSNTATKFYGELTQQMIKMGDSPGSDNGTGFFQTLASLKLREFYEKFSGVTIAAQEPANASA